jgi:hypothetical protein
MMKKGGCVRVHNIENTFIDFEKPVQLVMLFALLREGYAVLR